MNVSLNWTRKFTDISLPTEELLQIATERLGGIEGYDDIGKRYEGIVVAKIMGCSKHPNADKLQICKIDDGKVVKDVARDENGYVQVVCGALNAREGILVAWVPPSAVVPSSYGEKELFVLEARELRGELSNGMLASPRELGLNEDHDGILEITEQIAPGTRFVELYELDDVVISIENKMFTHRPDCFGQLGVARELAGIQHLPFSSPSWYLQPSLTGPDNSNISISIEDEKMCPRYMAVEIDGVTVAPSPLWLQSYLNRVGIRPINNVVDITNYIMMETAQPLHAFDYDKIAKNDKVHISVRRPQTGEKMLLLDGKTIEPHSEATLICNEDGPIALGGVKGGGNSEVDQNTTRIVLECATFNMYNVRKTSMVHGVFTDAVTRLNKGQPAKQLPSILGRAISMFEEITGAKAVGYQDSRPTQTTEDNDYIEVTAKFINDRLGSKFTDAQIVELLCNVEFKAHVASGPISVTPPFWRTDILLPEDIVEEIGRLYGFDQLPTALPRRQISPVSQNPMLALKSDIRTTLLRAGANELLTYSFVHGDLLKKANQQSESAYSLRNALSPDLQYYRLSILPSLLDKVRLNIKSGYDEFTLYEIGKGHNKSVVDEVTKLPDEINSLEMVYTSAKPKQGAAYYKMLRTVDALLLDLGIQYRLEPVIDDPILQILRPFDKTRSAYIFNATESGGMIGFVGELQNSVIKSFKLPEYTAAAIFALDGPSFYTGNRTGGKQYRPLSKYQSTKQDITLKVDQSLEFSKLAECLKAELSKSDYNYVLTPLGIYQQDTGTKNVTFNLELSHDERTLTTNEVNQLIEKLTWEANQRYSAQQV